jgi:hypothetical protein
MKKEKREREQEEWKGGGAGCWARDEVIRSPSSEGSNRGRVALRVVEEAKRDAQTPTSFRAQLTKQAHTRKGKAKKATKTNKTKLEVGA